MKLLNVICFNLNIISSQFKNRYLLNPLVNEIKFKCLIIRD